MPPKRNPRVPGLPGLAPGGQRVATPRDLQGSLHGVSSGGSSSSSSAGLQNVGNAAGYWLGVAPSVAVAAPPPPLRFSIPGGQVVTMPSPSDASQSSAAPGVLVVQPAEHPAKCPRRRDEPMVNPTRRGQKSLALAAASSAAAKKLALHNLTKDERAASSTDSEASLLKTWEEFHVAWFGPGVPVFPVTAFSLRCVGAMFKDGRYRAFKNYLARAKDRHEELTYPWTRTLLRVGKRTTRSVNRGLGPARQAGVLKLQEVHDLTLPPEPLVLGGPLCPGEAFEISALYGTREIETSLALRKSFQLDKERRLLRVHLPASKTDPVALGTYRTWGCTCGRQGHIPCPVCAWERHTAEMEKRFTPEQLADPLFPAFPDEHGRVVSKAKVVLTIQQLATTLNLPLLSETGDNLFSGHTIRVSGAVHLGEAGVEVFVIQILFRWISNTVLRYVAEAPLSGIAQKYSGALAQQAAREAREVTAAKVTRLQTKFEALKKGSLGKLGDLERTVEAIQDGTVSAGSLDDLRQEIADLKGGFAGLQEHILESVLEHLKEEPPEPRPQEVSLTIIKSLFKAHHRVVEMRNSVSRDKWRVACGWRFGTSMFDHADQLPEQSKHICDGCFPEEKRQARRGEEEALRAAANTGVAPDGEQEGGSSSSSSSDSSSSEDEV